MGYEIYFFDIPDQSGHVESGDRPSIVVNFSNHVFTIIPITTKMKAFGYNYICLIEPDTTNKLRAESVALVFHIMAIDSAWRRRKIGVLSDNDSSAITALLKEYLKLK